MSNSRKDIGVAILINLSFTIIEIFGGIWTNSLAILSDALHDLGDTITLIFAWVLEGKANKGPDFNRTYGYKRLSLLSAIFSGLILVVGSLFVLSRAIPRLLNPEHVNAAGMMGLAVLGITFNGFALWRLKGGKGLNSEIISWHFIEDVAGWVVILIGAIITYFVDLHIIDPIMTIIFTSVILFGVAKNLKEAFNLFMQGVPKNVNLKQIKQKVTELKKVKMVHDVHVWSLDGHTNILSMHAIISKSDLQKSDEIRRKIKSVLKKENIMHSTIEIESPEFCSGIECQAFSHTTKKHHSH